MTDKEVKRFFKKPDGWLDHWEPPTHINGQEIKDGKIIENGTEETPNQHAQGEESRP